MEDDALYAAYEQARINVPYSVARDPSAPRAKRFVVEKVITRNEGYDPDTEVVYRTDTYANASIRAGQLNTRWWNTIGRYEQEG
jgi:hypothetical protein